MAKKYKPRGDLGAKMVGRRLRDLEEWQNQLLQMVMYQNAAIRGIQRDVMDWFTLPPSCRTKVEMRKRVGLATESPSSDSKPHDSSVE